MKQLAILIFLVFSLYASPPAGAVSCSLQEGAFDSVPEPRLRYPIHDTVTVSKDQPLEFSWWNDVTDTRGFILKIYKGYNMYGANLILKENLPADADSLQVKAGLFEEGKVYTWSLARVSFSGSKSDRSFNSFKVIKG